MSALHTSGPRDTDLYLIWSYEHRAWWRPNSRGYTDDVYQAGLYTEEQGREIVTDHTDPVRGAMLPATAVFDAFVLDAERWWKQEGERVRRLRRCRRELDLPKSEGDPVKLAEQRSVLYRRARRG